MPRFGKAACAACSIVFVVTEISADTAYLRQHHLVAPGPGLKYMTALSIA